jgi:hypothetical protein
MKRSSRKFCFAFVIAFVVLSVALPAFGQNNRNPNSAQVQRLDPSGKQGTIPTAHYTGNAGATYGSHSYVTPGVQYPNRERLGSGNGQYGGQYYGQPNSASELHQGTTDRRFDGQTENAWSSGAQSDRTEWQNRGAWGSTATEQGNRRLTVNDEWWNDQPAARMPTAALASPSAVNRRTGEAQSSEIARPTSSAASITNGYRIDVPANRAVFTSVSSPHITSVTSAIDGYRRGNNFGSQFIVGARYPIGPGYFQPRYGFEYCSGYRYGGLFIGLNFGPMYDGIIVDAAEFVPAAWYYNVDDGYWYNETGESFAEAPVLGPEVPIGVLYPVWEGPRRVLVLTNAAYVPAFGTYGWVNSYGGGFGRLGFGVRTRNTYATAMLGY